MSADLVLSKSFGVRARKLWAFCSLLIIITYELIISKQIYGQIKTEIILRVGGVKGNICSLLFINKSCHRIAINYFRIDAAPTSPIFNSCIIVIENNYLNSNVLTLTLFKFQHYSNFFKLLFSYRYKVQIFGKVHKNWKISPKVFDTNL